jgi:hypothetical protein
MKNKTQKITKCVPTKFNDPIRRANYLKLLQKKCQLENELSNMKGMNVNISK